MKKFLDRYLFSKLGLQIVFSVVIILLFSFIGTKIRAYVTNHKSQDVYSQTFWGFRQITDGGSVAGTLDELDSVAEESGNDYGAPVVLVIALASWLIGMVLYSFVTGAVVNAFEGRKDKIEGGRARYRFKDHGIVIGWDFQGVASVMALLDVWGLKEVLVVSEMSAEDIRSELENELDDKSMRKVYIYNGTLGTDTDVDELYPDKAKVIMVLGDRNGFDNDGGNLRIGGVLRRKIAEAFKKNPPPEGAEPIRVFIDISNTYNLQAAEMYPSEGLSAPKGMAIHIINFCKATVRELYSSFAQFVEWNEGRKTGIYETPYRPLGFRQNERATHVHLVVSGMGDMARAIVLELAPLASFGSETGTITVFSKDEDEIERFSSAFPFDALHGVKVEFVHADIDSCDARSRLMEIVQDDTASVTIFLTNESADEALATANRLPRCTRYENVRLMVEQRILSKWAHKVYPLRILGFRDVAFFGFTDRFFASLGKRTELVSMLLAGDGSIHGGRDRYFAASIADGLLENLEQHGYCFEYDATSPRDGTESIPQETVRAMARYEHRRSVNFQLLHGVTAAKADDYFFQRSAKLCGWEELGDEDRATCIDRISKSLGAIQSFYGNGAIPFHIRPRRFRFVLGAIPDESVSESNEERSRIRDVVFPKKSETMLRKPDGTSKSGASMAVVVSPGRGLSWQMYKIALIDSIPMILLLPCPPDEFLTQFKDEDSREEMARCLRNADDIVVVEKGKSVNDEISSRADGLLARDDAGWRISEGLRNP